MTTSHPKECHYEWPYITVRCGTLKLPGCFSHTIAVGVLQSIHLRTKQGQACTVLAFGVSSDGPVLTVGEPIRLDGITNYGAPSIELAHSRMSAKNASPTF